MAGALVQAGTLHGVDIAHTGVVTTIGDHLMVGVDTMIHGLVLHLVGAEAGVVDITAAVIMAVDIMDITIIMETTTRHLAIQTMVQEETTPTQVVVVVSAVQLMHALQAEVAQHVVVAVV